MLKQKKSSITNGRRFQGSGIDGIRRHKTDLALFFFYFPNNFGFQSIKSFGIYTLLLSLLAKLGLNL